MAITSTITITIAYAGSGLTETYSPPIVLTNTASPGAQEPVALTTGFNSIAVPVGATSVVIVPPTASSITKTLKGITGDTGFPIAPAQVSVIGLPSNTATIGITASGNETVLMFFT